MWYVRHAIDFSIALNCIDCLEDHLSIKCSLWSFPNDCSCLIKLCFMSYISIGILIAFYLFFIHALCSTCLVLNEVYLLSTGVLGYRCIWCKCFTAFRFKCEWVLPMFPNSCLSLKFVSGFCHEIAKMGDCKVVISKCFVLALIPCQIWL